MCAGKEEKLEAFAVSVAAEKRKNLLIERIMVDDLCVQCYTLYKEFYFDFSVRLMSRKQSLSTVSLCYRQT